MQSADVCAYTNALWRYTNDGGINASRQYMNATMLQEQENKQTEQLNVTTIIQRNGPTSPDVLIFPVLKVLRQEINLEQLEVGRWWKGRSRAKFTATPD